MDDGTLAKELVVSPDRIDFGELRLGEVVSRGVEIRNAGTRTLHFLEPGRNCGCSRPILNARQLGPGERTTMSVELQAPLNPGPVAKSVWLECREFPGVERPIALVAQVAARIWAEPSTVDIEIPRGEMGTASVLLRHLSEVQITRVVSGAAEMNVEMADAGEVAREVKLRIDGSSLKAQEVVEGRLQVFLDSETAPALNVPVRWRARSKIRFAPGNLMVVPRDGGLRRTVAVLLDANVPADTLQIAALVPGVDVVSRKTQGRRVVVSLAVDTQQFSPGRNASAVRAWTSNGEEEDFLSIVRVSAE